MIIELDEEVALKSELDSAIRKRFPWASIDTKASPNTSRKRARQLTVTDPTTPRKADPIQHLKDFAAYAEYPPPDDEFGYQYPIGEEWGQLPYTRKIEIAHARAIQQHHGKVLEASPCSHCVKNDLTCKVYPAPASSFSVM
jgi:hypothetical protein